MRQGRDAQEAARRSAAGMRRIDEDRFWGGAGRGGAGRNRRLDRPAVHCGGWGRGGAGRGGAGPAVGALAAPWRRLAADARLDVIRAAWRVRVARMMLERGGAVRSVEVRPSGPGRLATVREGGRVMANMTFMAQGEAEAAASPMVMAASGFRRVGA